MPQEDRSKAAAKLQEHQDSPPGDRSEAAKRLKVQETLKKANATLDRIRHTKEDVWPRKDKYVEESQRKDKRLQISKDVKDSALQEFLSMRDEYSRIKHLDASNEWEKENKRSIDDASEEFNRKEESSPGLGHLRALGTPKEGKAPRRIK